MATQQKKNKASQNNSSKRSSRISSKSSSQPKQQEKQAAETGATQTRANHKIVGTAQTGVPAAQAAAKSAQAAAKRSKAVGPELRGPEGWRPEFRAFVSFPRLKFHSLCSLGVFSWKSVRAPAAGSRSAGVSHDDPEGPIVHFGGPQHFKHHRNSTGSRQGPGQGIWEVCLVEGKGGGGGGPVEDMKK